MYHSFKKFRSFDDIFAASDILKFRLRCDALEPSMAKHF